MPFAIIIPILIILLISIRQINEYERGILFTLGKYTTVYGAGWKLVIPIFQSMTKIDLRVRTVDVPSQECLTKDNIPVIVNAVMYFKVSDPQKAIINVENFYYASSQLAQTTMRNAIGEVLLAELLSNRDDISKNIKEIVDRATDPWGVKIEIVELKDILIPDELKRTIAKVAEAERERSAVLIRAEGELQAADNMAKAAQVLAGSPGALHLRTLQSINDISSDQSNTTIWMIPIETLRALEGIPGLVDKLKK